MRSFEQRKDEIFRRSKERIREKKRNRSYLLAACVTLVLCIGLYGAATVPVPDIERAESAVENDDALRDNLPEMESASDHVHILAQPQENYEIEGGYCGNTQTTLYIDGKTYTFMYGRSVELTDILINLRYDASKLCDCPAEYRADTEFGAGYEINLTQGFVRWEGGQADLTQEQLNAVTQIVEWAKKKV